MLRAEYEKLVRELFEIRLTLSGKKSKDYATEDVLSNFKRVAQRCAEYKVDIAKPEGVALFFILHKVDRLAKLVGEGVTPENESLMDNMADLENYTELLYAILSEGKV